MPTLGSNIRMARGAKGWSQAKLAAAAEVSTKTISKIETNQVAKPVAPVLARIARALDVHPEQLLIDPAPPSSNGAGNIQSGQRESNANQSNHAAEGRSDVPRANAADNTRESA